MNRSSSGGDDEAAATSSAIAATTEVHIRKHPPVAVFLEEVFETDVVVEGRGSFDGTTTFELLACLVEETSTNRVTAATLAVLQDPCPLPLGVSGTFRCCIRKRITADNHHNNARLLLDAHPIVRIHISAIHSNEVSSRNDDNNELVTSVVVATTVTSKILLAQYKILISPRVDWSNIWYKDEGGRDKCMEVMAGIYDHQRALLYETAPLLLTLCYSSNVKRCSAAPIPVTNQDILRIMGPKKANQLSIDETTGTIKIKFRVEDVSKNHQGQDFCVQIAVADSWESGRRIAPGLTPPITIRSKRNKRGRVSTTATTTFTATSTSNDVPSSEGKLQRSAPPLMEQYALDTRSRHGCGDGACWDAPDVMQLRDAVRSVSQWVDEVVTGLSPLQWQIVGYGRDASGNPDYSRPYHNMQNLNPMIARVLTIYNETTREQLQLLQQAFETQFSASSHYLSPMPFERTGSSALFPRDYYGPGRIPPGYALPSPRGYFEHSLLSVSPPLPPPPYVEHQPTQKQLSLPRASEALSKTKASKSSLDPPILKTSPIRNFVNRAGGSTSVMAPSDKSSILSETPRDASPDTRESEVEYLLAKQFKSIRTGELLGFPAYSSERELLGFYQQPRSTKMVGRGFFVPIRDEDFGPDEKLQATRILEEADEGAVQSMKQCGSVNNMLNLALVFEWRQDIAAQNKK